jgi:hypothetical protein
MKEKPQFIYSFFFFEIFLFYVSDRLFCGVFNLVIAVWLSLFVASVCIGLNFYSVWLYTNLVVTYVTFYWLYSSIINGNINFLLKKKRIINHSYSQI